MIKLRLENGSSLNAGIHDKDDPENGTVVDWVSVENKDGRQIHYSELADVPNTPNALRRWLHDVLQTAAR